LIQKTQILTPFIETEREVEVTMHIKNIFSDGELHEDAVCKKCLQTAADGKKLRGFVLQPRSESTTG